MGQSKDDKIFAHLEKRCYMNYKTTYEIVPSSEFLDQRKTSYLVLKINNSSMIISLLFKMSDI